MFGFGQTGSLAIGQLPIIAPPVSAWYPAWSLPVWYKVLHVSRHPTFQPYQETARFPEVVFEDRWHYQWSEPVRLKPYPQSSYKVGLQAELQQFYTAPPRLMPRPNLSGVWASTETKDRIIVLESLGALAKVILPFNQPVSARVGIEEIPVPGTPGASIGFVA